MSEQIVRNREFWKDIPVRLETLEIILDDALRLKKITKIWRKIPCI